MPILSFNSELHYYYVDGFRVPSVTQVLEAAGVVDYSYLPPSTRTMALQRGGAVHLVTQFDDEGDLDEALLDPALAPYLAAWRRFRQETGFTPTLIEHRGFHEQYRYAGTLDRRGTFPDGTEAILDLKTNQAEGWVRLQIAAYAALFPDARKFRRVCVEVHGDGTYRMLEFPAAEHGKDFGGFLACLAVMRLQEQFGRLVPAKERKIA